MNNFDFYTLLQKASLNSKHECWEWDYYLNSDGYGRVKLEGVQCRVHRKSYEYFIEKLEADDVVLHKCDNRKYFNFHHLQKGTHNDNVQDRVSKNRSAFGTGNGRNKLTETQVLEIFNSPLDYNLLGRLYKVDRKNIVHIKTKKTWKYLTKDL